MENLTEKNDYKKNILGAKLFPNYINLCKKVNKNGN